MTLACAIGICNKEAASNREVKTGSFILTPFSLDKGRYSNNCASYFDTILTPVCPNGVDKNATTCKESRTRSVIIFEPVFFIGLSEEIRAWVCAD